MTQTIQTILFDFDGTLTPSLELWLQAFQHALARRERTVPEATIIQRFFYREFLDVVREFDLPDGDTFGAHVYDGLTLAFAAPRLWPGVRDVLDFCRDVLQIPLGLVTSSPRPQVETALAAMGLDETFAVIVTGSDITHFKPHPEPVVRALRFLDAHAPDTLFVGDYTADVLAGQAAGTRTALFLPDSHTRFYDFSTLRATSPDFIFSDYDDLLAHLRLHGNSQNGKNSVS